MSSILHKSFQLECVLKVQFSHVFENAHFVEYYKKKKRFFAFWAEMSRNFKRLQNGYKNILSKLHKFAGFLLFDIYTENGYNANSHKKRRQGRTIRCLHKSANCRLEYIRAAGKALMGTVLLP